MVGGSEAEGTLIFRRLWVTKDVKETAVKDVNETAV